MRLRPTIATGDEASRRGRCWRDSLYAARGSWHWSGTQKLGFDMDLREYGLGAQILADLGLKTIRLLTNNPRKVVGLEGYGLEIVEQVPIKVKPNPHNLRYLNTKREKLGHLL